MNTIQEPEAQNSEFSRPETFTGRRRGSEGITEAKNELLQDLDREQLKPLNISAQSLIWVYIVLFFTLLVTLPRIYIANQVYYVSKDINTKYHKYTALLEENRYLKKRIEQLTYQRQVVDSVEIP
ncbi:MAG TPA: hypothetical protein ENK97_03260 [Campylobacteraceae bacterium]|nr:hypothetical protein [Campylobacteraceae bacterium]